MIFDFFKNNYLSLELLNFLATGRLRNGLRYLNSAGRKIIHYDIKPSNLFYNAGQATFDKLTDTGKEYVVSHVDGSVAQECKMMCRRNSYENGQCSFVLHCLLILLFAGEDR